MDPYDEELDAYMMKMQHIAATVEHWLDSDTKKVTYNYTTGRVEISNLGGIVYAPVLVALAHFGGHIEVISNNQCVGVIEVQ